jgi:Rieske Fe-S protein
VPLADVPVGEAVVVDVDGTRVVVARPSEDEVVAFSANCTHAGTVVEATGGLELRCPNHGSRFDAGDGAAVLDGPAEQPLPPVPASIEGDLVVLSV